MDVRKGILSAGGNNFPCTVCKLLALGHNRLAVDHELKIDRRTVGFAGSYSYDCSNLLQAALKYNFELSVITS